MRSTTAILLLTLGALALAIAGSRSPEISFRSQQLDGGIAETCDIADFNNDGRPDIFSGDAWYENPTWKKHTVRNLQEYGTYLATLTDVALDVDGDGWTDIVSSGWHPRRIWWSRNPGRTAKPGTLWEDKTIDEGYNVEFHFMVDLDNDGKAHEILPQFGSEKAPLAWYALKNGRFEKYIASPRSYGHGIGAGDINKDGRTDILTPRGWLEAPADPRQPDWTFHPVFDLKSTSFMYVIDINEDGLPDILTGMAHDFGVFWMEQQPGGKWVKRVIDESWSQPHAITLVDLNGDGRKNILTGKRFMAHDGKDPGEREPLGLYWYEYRKAADGSVAWHRHLIEYGGRIGAGMQLPVADLDNDGDLDFAAPGKSGLYLFENLTRKGRP
jgi:hypothetical protein